MNKYYTKKRNTVERIIDRIDSSYAKESAVAQIVINALDKKLSSQELGCLYVLLLTSRRPLRPDWQSEAEAPYLKLLYSGED